MSIEWHGDKVKKTVHQATLDGLEIVCYKVDAEAKKLCPVDTGRLRSSIGHKVNKRKMDGTISAGEYQAFDGSIVKYANYVEMGTKRMPPQPYLRPALELIRPEMGGIVQGQIAKALK